MVLHALCFDNPQALCRAIAPPFQADHGDSSISSEPITLLGDGLQLCSLATSWGRSSSPRLCSTTLRTSRLATRPRAKRLQRRYISQKDITYISLGIFFAHLSSIYGEGAFERLLLEIAARPHEISALNSGLVGDCSDQLQRSFIWDFNKTSQYQLVWHRPETYQITLRITRSITRHGVWSPYVHPLADAQSVK
jgi:hypothetical protein